MNKCLENKGIRFFYSVGIFKLLRFKEKNKVFLTLNFITKENLIFFFLNLSNQANTQNFLTLFPYLDFSVF